MWCSVVRVCCNVCCILDPVQQCSVLQVCYSALCSVSHVCCSVWCILHPHQYSQKLGTLKMTDQFVYDSNYFVIWSLKISSCMIRTISLLDHCKYLLPSASTNFIAYTHVLLYFIRQTRNLHVKHSQRMCSASDKLLAYIHVRPHSIKPIAHCKCPTLTKTVLYIHHVTCIHPCAPMCFHASSTHLKSQTLTKKVLCVHQITSADTRLPHFIRQTCIVNVKQHSESERWWSHTNTHTLAHTHTAPVRPHINTEDTHSPNI